jgi:protein-tyrosine phosphatase
LPLKGGGATRPGCIWRAGHPDGLDAAGWEQLRDLGITTVVDLRNAYERSLAHDTPDGIRIVHAPIEDVEHPAYFGRWKNDWATPDFFAWGRRTWPDLWRSAFAAIADASGGVLLHCAAGRDRTGMMTATLLQTAGVEREAVLDDYDRGIRESDNRNVDDLVDDYREALGRLLDRWEPEPELVTAALKLRPAISSRPADR